MRRRERSGPTAGEAADRCAECGLEVAGGTEGCHALLEELLARDFTEAAYFRYHRLMVDTYCLQHPARYCISAKSFAAHLTGLCWLLEQGGTRALGSEALRKWLNGPTPLQKPELPAFRGAMTVADVRHQPDAESYGQAVERWAHSTWDAYAPLHGLAHAWIQQALAR